MFLILTNQVLRRACNEKEISFNHFVLTIYLRPASYTFAGKQEGRFVNILYIVDWINYFMKPNEHITIIMITKKKKVAP